MKLITVKEGLAMITINDVAAESGLSVGTVSKVINNLNVKEANRKRVMDAIEKLGYQVNTYARGFKIDKTYTVAIIVPDLINPFFALFVNFAEKTLVGEGYKLLVCTTYGDAEKESSYISVVMRNRVDGIILISYHHIENELKNFTVPTVSIDRHLESSGCCISGDNEKGGRLAAEKFIRTGCKNVVYLHNGSNLAGETLKRGKSFIETCRRANLSADEIDFGEETTLNEFQISRIYEFIERNFSAGRFAYDGIFTSSDIHAVLVTKKIRQLGIKVPEEVQIIGYDGLKILNVSDYAVSSIAQPIKNMATASVNALLGLIKKESVEKNIILPVQFVEGGTTRKDKDL
jgi:LacI family transcriptional regulator